MNPKTKKYLLIGGAVVAVGAAIWWFFVRNKTDETAESKKLGIKPVSGRFKKAIKKKGDLKSKIGQKAPIVQTAQPDQI